MAYPRNPLGSIYESPKAGGNSLQINGHVYGNIKPLDVVKPIEECLKSIYFKEMDKREHDIQKPCRGTCEWLLRNEKYITWTKQSAGLLWIKGNPGAGKSTLMKYALESERRKQPSSDDASDYVIASFFFQKGGNHLQETTLGLFRALLYQILTNIQPLLAELHQLFQNRFKTQGAQGEAWDWHEEELRDFFTSRIANGRKRYRIKIFIDALDECNQELAIALVRYFKDLTSASKSCISVCFSCRHWPPLDHGDDSEEICVEGANNEDILTYIRTELRPVFQDQGPKFHALESEIEGKASGIFQWVKIAVSKVITLHDEGESTMDIQDAILTFPNILEDLYRTIIQSIDKRFMPRALHLMQWICFAAKPLSLSELRFAMTSDWPNPPGRTQRFHHELERSRKYESDEQIERLARSLSRGLIIVTNDREERIVQFIHDSVREYLIQDGLEFLNVVKGNQAGQAHQRLLRSCINYVTLEDLCENIQNRPIQQLPFLSYALTSWIFHAKKAEFYGLLQHDLPLLFEWPSPIILQRWISAYRAACAPFGDKSLEAPDKQTTLLHIASEYGFSAIETMLLAEGINLDATDTKGRTMLSYATENGRMGIIKLLLSKKVAVDTKDWGGRTPLSYAAENGHIDAMQLLLDRDAKADSSAKHGHTPLAYAAENGYEQVVRLLLTKPVNLNRQGEFGRTSLSWAAGNGYGNIVELLLKTGRVDVDFPDHYKRTALSYAAENGYGKVVKLLLNGNAKVDLRDEMLRTPLWYAADSGSREVVRLLLKAGADPNARDSEDWPPLKWARGNNHPEVVRLLVNAGASDEEVRRSIGEGHVEGVQV